MLPTISAKGDGVIVLRIYRRGRNIRVGDMVNIKHPLFPNFGAIKRVVGMPGDFVSRDGLGGQTMVQVRV